MPAEPKSFVKAATDPFEAPILAALREPPAGDTVGMGIRGEYRIYLHGDWEGVGRSSRGAQKLLTAVTNCFEAEGIKPDTAAFLPQKMTKRIARAPEDGSQACLLTLDFKERPQVHEQVAAALQKTLDASLAMQERARSH